jgi:hypothetical protein
MVSGRYALYLRNNGNGILAGKKLFCAKRTNVIEDLFHPKKATQVCQTEITSLKIYIASLSKAFVFLIVTHIFRLRLK